MVQRRCGPVNCVIQKTVKAKPIVAHADKVRPCYRYKKGEWTEVKTLSSREGAVTIRAGLSLRGPMPNL